MWKIDKEEDVNKIIDIINVPYIDYFEVKKSANSVYDLLHKGSKDFYSINFLINEDKLFSLRIYSLGYVSLTTAGKNYVSLTRVDFESISILCDGIRTSLK